MDISCHPASHIDTCTLVHSSLGHFGTLALGYFDTWTFGHWDTWILGHLALATFTLVDMYSRPLAQFPLAGVGCCSATEPLGTRKWPDCRGALSYFFQSEGHCGSEGQGVVLLWVWGTVGALWLGPGGGHRWAPASSLQRLGSCTLDPLANSWGYSALVVV